MDVKRLKTVPLFGGLSHPQLQELAEWIDEVDLPAGKRLLNEGAFAYEFVLIQSGTANVIIEGRHVNDLGAGDFFGEIALLATTRRTASVETTSPMRAGVITGANFRAMVRKFPQIAEKVRVAMDERLRRTGKAATEAQRDALSERIFAATLSSLELLHLYLGERLGLYRVLADHDEGMTSSEMATVAEISERYAREWLEQQAVAGMIEV